MIQEGRIDHKRFEDKLFILLCILIIIIITIITIYYEMKLIRERRMRERIQNERIRSNTSVYYY